jgi:hypothetical protein
MGTAITTLFAIARAVLWLRRAAGEFPGRRPDGTLLTATLPFAIRF